MARLQRIEVDADLKTHRKSAALAVMLQDPRAWTWLVDMWMWASHNEPSGLIPGPAARLVLEHVLGWGGKPGVLVEAFIASGWLDVRDNGLYIHDWHDHAGAHIAHAEKEAERAREYRAQVRNKFSIVKTDAVRTPDVQARARTDEDETSTEPCETGNSNRNRNQNLKEETLSSNKPDEKPPDVPLLTSEDAKSTSAVDEVLDHYGAAMKANGRTTKKTKKGRRLVSDRLKEGLGAPLLKQAIDGLTWSDWHMGRDPKTNGQSFTGLRYCLGDEERVMDFANKVPKHARSAG